MLGGDFLKYSHNPLFFPEFICGYDVISLKHDVPFVIEIKNRTTGVAQIKLVEGARLNFEKRARYKFSIIAYDCGSPRRESNK